MAKAVTPKKAVAPKKAVKTVAPKKVKEPEQKETAPSFQYQILSASELPEPVRSPRSGPSPYPFSSLQVDEGFVVPLAKTDRALYTNDVEYNKAKKEELRTISNRLTGAVRRFTKAHAGTKFRVSTAESSIVVRRVE